MEGLGAKEARTPCYQDYSRRSARSAGAGSSKNKKDS